MSNEQNKPSFTDEQLMMLDGVATMKLVAEYGAASFPAHQHKILAVNIAVGQLETVAKHLEEIRGAIKDDDMQSAVVTAECAQVHYSAMLEGLIVTLPDRAREAYMLALSMSNQVISQGGPVMQPTDILKHPLFGPLLYATVDARAAEAEEVSPEATKEETTDDSPPDAQGAHSNEAPKGDGGALEN